jgi:hypothetical protein
LDRMPVQRWRAVCPARLLALTLAPLPSISLRQPMKSGANFTKLHFGRKLHLQINWTHFQKPKTAINIADHLEFKVL